MKFSSAVLCVLACLPPHIERDHTLEVSAHEAARSEFRPQDVGTRLAQVTSCHAAREPQPAERHERYQEVVASLSVSAAWWRQVELSCHPLGMMNDGGGYTPPPLLAILSYPSLIASPRTAPRQADERAAQDCEWRGKREIPEKTRRPVASSSTTPTMRKSLSDPALYRIRFS
ncbi:hypothetical protein PR048_025930 [Dryococelus australis]|uniref:Uncharacterized protein n=1 Tax=Dryococelus australis TaxID=614101 RepID=A0ABQ9GJX1_9NEOP|nr:hypothetical protein PR048_025930 [Dryococelus australis]